MLEPQIVHDNGSSGSRNSIQSYPSPIAGNNNNYNNPHLDNNNSISPNKKPKKTHHQCIYCNPNSNNTESPDNYVPMVIQNLSYVTSTTNKRNYPIESNNDTNNYQLNCKNTGVLLLQCAQPNCSEQFVCVSKFGSTYQLKLKNLKQSFRSDTHPLKLHYKNYHHNILATAKLEYDRKITDMKENLEKAKAMNPELKENSSAPNSSNNLSRIDVIKLTKAYRAIFLEAITSDDQQVSTMLEQKWVERLEPSIRYIKKSKAERKGDDNGNANGLIRTGKVGRPRKQEIQPQKVVNNSINIKTESENNNNNHGNNKTNILIKNIN